MPTVGELSAPFENYLRPVLPVGPGVCSICHTSVAGGWPRCYQCGRAQKELPMTASAISFVALAVKDEQFARDLYQYKDPRQSEQERRRLRLGLAAVLCGGSVTTRSACHGVSVFRSSRSCLRCQAPDSARAILSRSLWGAMSR